MLRSILPPGSGIGDPSVLGWLTTAGYALASVLALLASRATRRSLPSAGPLVRFWQVVAGVLVLLGLNKQLDFQLWLSYYGRRLALEQGWYEHRGGVQLAFVVLFGLVIGSGLAWLVWLVRGFLPRSWLALSGLFLLACFVLLRAVSIDVTDLRILVRGENVIWVIEVVGILVVAVAAALAGRSGSR